MISGPPISRLQRASNVSLVVIAVIAAVAAMQYAQNVLAPVILAIVVGIVLSPISDMFERMGLSSVWGAMSGLLLTLALIVGIGLLIEPVVANVIDAWPRIMRESQAFVREVQNTLRDLQEATDEVDRALTGTATDGDPAEQTGGVGLPTTTDALFLAPAVLGQAVIFIGALFFFLLTRHETYLFLSRFAAENAEQRREFAARLKHAERQVARYFLTITIINVGLGAAVAIGLTLVGMPQALLWGTAAGLLNYLLYIGPATMAAALLVGGIVAFDGATSVVPMLIYVGCNMTEAQFITPTAIGKSLAVSPLLVFLALVLFLWLWGPMGGFIAIPLLLWCIAIGTAVRDRRMVAPAKVE